MNLVVYYVICAVCGVAWLVEIIIQVKTYKETKRNRIAAERLVKLLEDQAKKPPAP